MSNLISNLSNLNFKGGENMEKKKWLQIDEEIFMDMLILANNFNYQSTIEQLKIHFAKVEYNNRIYEIHVEEKNNHTVVTYINKVAIIYEDGFFTIEEIEEV